MTDSEQHSRKLASETRASAEFLLDPYSKRTLLLIAQRYDMLAERAQRQEKEVAAKQSDVA